MKTVRVAAIDVDAQKGFTPLCPDELPVPGGDTIVDALNEMALYADIRVASKDAHSPQALWVAKSKDEMLSPTGLPHADISWVTHCVPGTKGFESLDGLPSPLDYDFMVYKGIEPDMHPYGACYHDSKDQRSTGLIEFLKDRGVTCVLVGGLALEFCVATTARQLVRAGFMVVLYTPACRALSPELTNFTLDKMSKNGIVIANNVQELKEAAVRG